MSTKDAEYYQTHKDDPGEWGEPEPTKKSGKRRLASMISARFAPEEEELVRRAAAERGESVSRFVRGPGRESEEGGAVIAAPMASVLLRPTGTARLAST